jgi:hypothetical protein
MVSCDLPTGDQTMIHTLKELFTIPAEALGLVAFMAGLGLLLRFAEILLA